MGFRLPSEILHSKLTLMLFSIGCCTTVLSIYFWQRRRRVAARIPQKWRKVGVVTEVYVYPLKSGASIPLTEAKCLKTGVAIVRPPDEVLLQDRSFVVYRQDNFEFCTARTYPKMLKIKTSLKSENSGNVICMKAPEVSSLTIDKSTDIHTKAIYIGFWCRERIQGYDCGDKAADWISKYILNKNTGLRLAYHCGQQNRNLAQTHQLYLEYYKKLSNESTGLFSDLSSIHLVTENSITDLNERLKEHCITVSTLNFRPNIVVRGDDSLVEPYSEQQWNWLRIGHHVILRNVKDCTRCIMTTLNPITGNRNSGGQPLKLLSSYQVSKGPKNGAVMGVNMEVRSQGILKVGDEVYLPDTVA